jgi:flagella basal body P-ring formation protein FlgA
VLVAFAAMLVCARGSLAQENTIALRPLARLQQAGPVTLGEVADLAGPEALRLKALVVVEDFSKAAGASQELRLELAKVRALIETQPGVNMGRLLISGGSSVVKLGGIEPAPNSSRGPQTSAAPANRSNAGGASAKALLTHLGARVCERIALMLDVPETDLRVTFAASDQSLLATPLVGRTLVLQPGGQGARMPINVRVFEGDRIVATGTVRPSVEVRRVVLVASSHIARGDAIDVRNAVRETRWLSPVVVPADPSKAVGTNARFAIAPGEVIEARGVESPVVVERGDLVAVDCLSGSFVVRAQARAMAPGRVGDVVEFVITGSKRPFRARIDGPGRAVMVGEGGEAPADARADTRADIRPDTRPDTGAAASFPLRTIHSNTPAEPTQEHNAVKGVAARPVGAR